MIPIVGGIGLVAVVIYFVWRDRPQLNGELTSVRLEEFVPPPGGIGRGDVSDLPDQTIDYVLDELAEHPARLTSSLMETEFRGTRRGIEVYLLEGQETTFFRVAPRENEDFDQWVQQHAAALEKPRQNEFQDAVKRFFKEFDETDGDLPDLPGYRDPLGLGAMVGRVGYNMAAVVGGKVYRCVYEDAERRLYFLLPQGTRQFELTGRQLDDGRTLFPGSYLVKVE